MTLYLAHILECIEYRRARGPVMNAASNMQRKPAKGPQPAQTIRRPRRPGSTRRWQKTEGHRSWQTVMRFVGNNAYKISARP
jgi:hypothetical protein